MPCVSCLFVCRLVLLLCVFASLACSDRLFLACLFVVRLMYCVCIANMPFSQFLKFCISDKNSKQVAIQNAMCFLLVCLSVGFALVCFLFACMFNG